MSIAAVRETGKNIAALPIETIQLPDQELLKVFKDGATLLFNQRHATPLVGQRGKEEKQKVTWYTP